LASDERTGGGDRLATLREPTARGQFRRDAGEKDDRQMQILNLWNALKGWRTLLLSVAMAVIGALQTADWATIIAPAAVGPLMLWLSAAVAVLRVLTTTPVGKR
jgi:hypothetical protein